MRTAYRFSRYLSIYILQLVSPSRVCKQLCKPFCFAARRTPCWMGKNLSSYQKKRSSSSNWNFRKKNVKSTRWLKLAVKPSLIAISGREPCSSTEYSSISSLLTSDMFCRNYHQVLVLLLRLRQICSHPSLIQEDGVAFVDPKEADVNLEFASELTRARRLVSPEFVDNLKEKFKASALKRIQAEKEVHFLRVSTNIS